ncbi:MAG: hypothetical protein L0229_14740 [Blastocatellia bacterium]|nr:hypothetical protein [Blastocatellia bacterium]
MMKSHSSRTIDAGANTAVCEELIFDSKNGDIAKAVPGGFTSLSLAIISQFGDLTESSEAEIAGTESES